LPGFTATTGKKQRARISLSYKGTGSCTATFSVLFLERAECNFKKEQDINKWALAWELPPKDQLIFMT